MEAINLQKSEIYSDIKEVSNSDATFLKYLGSDKSGYYFKYVAGHQSYSTENHSEYGTCIGFLSLGGFYEVPEEVLQKLNLK